MGRREDVDSLAARGDEAQRAGVPPVKMDEERKLRRNREGENGMEGSG